MGKHKIDKKSQQSAKGHNKVGTGAQAPTVESWGRN